MGKRLDISFTSEDFPSKLDKLKDIYNIKTNNKLIEHLVNLELQRFNVKEDKKEAKQS